MLVAKSISKSFGGTPIIQDVSLELSPGFCCSILGPNGAGKSIFLHCLSQILSPDRGTIWVDDDRVDFPSDDKTQVPWPIVTIMLQHLAHWPHLSFRSALKLVTKKKDLANHVLSLAEKLEVIDLLDKFPHQCSGGEKQRLALVRSLALRPKYLLIDEPTAAVDLAGAKLVSEVLNQAKKEGVGIVAVTHHLGFAKAISDQIGFMIKGRLVETGGLELLKEATDPEAVEFLGIMSAS